MGFRHLECNSSAKLIEEVMRVTGEFELRHLPGAIPFFRGHSSTAYQLLPGLFRRAEDGDYSDYDEENFYHEFRARAGALLSPNLSSWDILFLMQHHRVPTRILDWTESFATALYFALENATSDIDVWMLDPYMFNNHFLNVAEILDVETDIGREYFDLFVKRPREEEPGWPAAAIYPRRQIARLASQHGLFTLHVARQPLEDMDGAECLTRFRLSGSAAEEARTFLRVMGVNDFSLFPDLDGLGRLLRKRIRAGVPDPYGPGERTTGTARLPSVRGDLLFKLVRLDEARAEFERAATLTQNARERALLLNRATACARPSAAPSLN